MGGVCGWGGSYQITMQPQARTTGRRRRRSKQHSRMQVTSITNNYRRVKVGVGVKRKEEKRKTRKEQAEGRGKMSSQQAGAGDLRGTREREAGMSNK